MVNAQDFVEHNSTSVEIYRNKSVLHLDCVSFTDCPIDEKVRQARESLHACLTAVLWTIPRDGGTLFCVCKPEPRSF